MDKEFEEALARLKKYKEEKDNVLMETLHNEGQEAYKKKLEEYKALEKANSEYDLYRIVEDYLERKYVASE